MDQGVTSNGGSEFKSAFLSANMNDYLKKTDVANGIIEQIARELSIPRVIVRPIYYWLLVPAVKKVEEGLGDVALNAAVKRVHALAESRVGVATLAVVSEGVAHPG